MANMKKTIISGILVGTMAFAGIGTTAFDLNEEFFPSSTISASAASLYIPELTGNNYIEWYCSNSGQTKVYTSSSFKTRGSSANKNGSGCRSYNAYIDKNDKCYICKMTSKYIFLKYPAGSTYRYGYIRTSDVTGLSQTSGAFKSKAGGIKTYSSSDLGTKIGSIDKNDTIYLLNKKSGNYQLVYSLTGSSSFKIGWVSSGDYNSIKKGSTSVSTTKLSYGLYKNNSARITCGFDGYTSTPGRHEGIDISYAIGKPVYSLTDGVVTRVYSGWNGSGGLSTIAVYNASQNKTVVYLHTEPLSSIKVGQYISKGQQIAKQAWRGVSSASGSHTHVEVCNGRQTAAKKSVGDYRLENPNPTSFWRTMGYTIG